MALNTTTKKFTIAEPNTETLGALLEQLGSLIGVGPRDDGRIYLADLCIADGVNIWAKYKPMNYNKESNLTDSERDLLDYGLRQGDDFFYYWVKPTSWKRLRDFDGYNHKAIPPMQNSEHLGGKASFIGGSVITLDPWKIVATGENVEIPLDRLGSNFAQGYVGLAFINRANKKGWVHSTDYKLQDVIDNTSKLYSIQFPFEDAPNVADGNIIDVYYCLTPTPEWYFAEYSDNSGVQIMCCDEKHGHAEITARKMTMSQMSIDTPTVYMSYNGYNATFTGCSFNLRCTFPFSDFGAAGLIGDDMTFELYINGKLCGSTTQHVDSARESVSISNGSITVNADTLRDDEYLVHVQVTGRFTSQSGNSTTFFNRYYNVQSQTYV